MKMFPLFAAVIVMAVPVSAPEAQVAGPYRAQPRFVIFGDAVMSKPKGEFANYVDQGFGFNGGAMMRLDPAGMFGVRAEVGGLQYGRERMPVAFEDRQTSENFATTENASDFASAIVFGGGVYVPLGGRASTAMLTLGGKYYYGGEATYLPEGGIQDNPDGTITLSPARTKTDFVIWQLGVSVGIPSRGR